MTERELFAAYRVIDGYEADCACGGVIRADSGDEASVHAAVAVHNESTVHAQWSAWQEAVHALQRPTRRPCPCHEGLGDKSVSPSCDNERSGSSAPSLRLPNDARVSATTRGAGVVAPIEVVAR